MIFHLLIRNYVLVLRQKYDPNEPNGLTKHRFCTVFNKNKTKTNPKTTHFWHLLKCTLDYNQIFCGSLLIGWYIKRALSTAFWLTIKKVGSVHIRPLGATKNGKKTNNTINQNFFVLWLHNLQCWTICVKSFWNDSISVHMHGCKFGQTSPHSMAIFNQSHLNSPLLCWLPTFIVVFFIPLVCVVNFVFWWW